MRRLLVLLLLACATPAAAGTPQISAEAPIAGLPAVSKDHKQYARPVVVQPKDCTGTQTFVEIGLVGTSSSQSGQGDLLLVADDCGPGKKIAANIERINTRLSEGNYVSVGTAEARSLPTTIKTKSGSIDVDAASGNQVVVAMAGSAADKWSVKLEGDVIEVHAWYDAEDVDGAPYIAVQLAVAAKDTGAKGRERWVQFWPVEGAGAETGTPVEIGERFVEALAAHDAGGVQDLLSAPFWKVGLKPETGAQKKACKKLDKAKKDRDLAKVARCMSTGASSLYAKFKASEHVAEIGMDEFPDELKKQKKKVAKLVKKGAKLVRYHVNQDGFYVFLVLVLDVETNLATVGAALEYIDVDGEQAGE